MIEVDVPEAVRRLDQLLDLVAAGEDIVITRAGLPVARLTTVEPQKKNRTPGSARGQIFVSDDFDDPLPRDILDAFEGRNDT